MPNLIYPQVDNSTQDSMAFANLTKLDICRFQMPHHAHYQLVAESTVKRENNFPFNAAARPPKIELGMKSDGSNIFSGNNTTQKDGSMNESSDLLAFLRLHHAKELNEGVQVNDSSRSLTKLNTPYSEDNEIEQIVVYPNGYEESLDPPPEPKPSYKKGNKGDVISGPCCVCEAEKAGFHFGAIACAACSAFFRRTISEKRKYTCKKEGPDHMNCPIDKHHRCYCRACRLQKCLDQGMDPMAVQPHRDSIGAKQNSTPGIKRSLESPTSLSERRRKRSSPESTPKLVSLDEPINRIPLTPSDKPQISPQLSMFNQHVRTDGLIMPKLEIDGEFEFGVRPGSSASRPELTLEDSISSTQSHTSSEGNFPPYDPHQNMIECMVIEYRKLQERRRLIYCPSTIRDILSGTPAVPRPTKFFERHRMEKNRLRIEISMYVEFLNSIHPFPKLSLDDKIALLKHLSISFAILEKFYNTMKAGGLQSNRIIHADGSFYDLEAPESVEITLNGEPLDKETFLKLFVVPLKESLHELSGAMYHNGTTDIEFCALVAILLFDPSAPGLDEGTRRIVKDARDRVYSDWFAFYRAHNIQDGSERMGNTMLLLPAVLTIVEKTAENFHLIRVFELFDYDKFLDEVFNSGVCRD
ncbi:unnamed protein product [Auanema sp. JU1783]|nr:unnamed protein product [Auanema sp. JU1783]